MNATQNTQITAEKPLPVKLKFFVTVVEPLEVEVSFPLYLKSEAHHVKVVAINKAIVLSDSWEYVFKQEDAGSWLRLYERDLMQVITEAQFEAERERLLTILKSIGK